MQSLFYKNAVCLSGLMILTACASTTVLRPPEYQVPKIQVDEQYKYASLNWQQPAHCSQLWRTGGRFIKTLCSVS